MKKSLIFLSLFLLTAFSQINAQKIGYVDSDSVLVSMPEYRVQTKQYESYAGQLQKQVQDQEKELQEKYQKFLQEQGDLIPEVLQKRQQDLQAMQQSLQEFAQQSQTNLARKEQQLMQPLLKKVQEAINDVAKEEGFDFIVSKEMFLFSNTQYEITSSVIKKVTGSATSPETSSGGN